MPGSRCARCGREEFLPFRCRLCGEPHCLDHRLPENHGCRNLEGWRARTRAAGGPWMPDPEREAVPRGRAGAVKVRGPSPVGDAFGTVGRFFTRSMTHRLLGLVLLTYAVQWLGGMAYGTASGAGAMAGVGEVTCLLALGSCGGGPFTLATLAAKPWSPITSVFAHSPSPFHLFFNAIFLYFFGLALEQRVGGKRLLQVFLAAGILAGFAQAVLFGGAVLGASGGLMAVLGVLTILAPTLQVIFWFFPLPLWVMTVFYVMLDIMGVFGPAAGIANLAHLAGLALGLAYGIHLRKRGVLPRVTSTWAFTRRL